MTRQLSFCEGETVSETDRIDDADVIHTEDLWIVQFRQDETYPWADYGTHKAEWRDVLRVYDYREEHVPEMQHRMIQATVIRRLADPEKLREILRQESAEEAPADLQSN